MIGRLLLGCTIVPIILALLVPGDTHTGWSACAPGGSGRLAVNIVPTSQGTKGCSLVSGLDVAISRGTRWTSAGYPVSYVVTAAGAAGIDPRLLLAVLIRESGDFHSFDWLSNTPLAQIHHFSIGVANMDRAAFEEARAYAGAAINYGWNAIGSDPAKAITAAAFLLAKRRSQLEPRRSANYTDAEYIRIGYRAGYRVMAAAQRTGSYQPGVELFDLAYRTAGQLIDPPPGYRLVRRSTGGELSDATH